MTLNNINSNIFQSYCINNNNCSNGYHCVSVDTHNPNLLPYIPVSQCVKKQTCSGNKFGNCPDFSLWSTEYKNINAKCVFSFVNGCDINIECYKNINNDTYGIYKCIDTNTINIVIDLDNHNTAIPSNNTAIPITTKNNNDTIVSNNTTIKPVNTNTPINKSHVNKIILNVICIIINFTIIFSIN